MLTSNLGDWTDSGVANGNCPVWNSGTSKWTPGSCGGGGTQIVAGNNVAIPQGSPCTGPICTINSLANGSQCDIRSQGATLNAQDIGPYIQDCINAYYPFAAGNTQTILLPCGNGSTNGNSCWWAHPSALTFPHGGPVKILLSGYLSVGSPLVVDGNQNWYGTGPPGVPVQFQPSVLAGLFAPQLYGTLGSNCATPNAPCVVTPTFSCSGTSQNSIFGNCNIGYMPPGAAITIAGTTTCSSAGPPCSAGVSAAAVNTGSGYRAVTLTLPAQPRFVALEPMTVAGCSDATLNITGGMFAKVTFNADGTETAIYYQSTTTSPTTATGCGVTSFDEDKYESLRLWCSNGTLYSVQPPGSSSCSTGQWTVWPIHAHSSSDQWGAVAVTEAFEDQNGHTFNDLSIYGAEGMSYWSEQGSNGFLNNIGMTPNGLITSGGMEMTAVWVMHLNNLYYETNAANPFTCMGGGCGTVPYPYGLRCDSESSGINTGGAGPVGGSCASSFINGGAFLGGGIKIDGQGVNPIIAMPNEIGNMLLEQVSSSAVTIDNRTNIDTTQCPSIHDDALQDNVTGQAVYYLGYTNPSQAALGCYKLSNLSTALTTAMTNPYVNDANVFDTVAYATQQSNQNNTTTSHTQNDGKELQGALRGSGAGFGPQLLPFGSLAIDTAVSAWQADCTASSCGTTFTTTNVMCPDGPQASSKMQCAELDGPGSPFPIGTWTGGTYAGDQFIYGCYIRPGAGFAFPQGLQNQDVFFIKTSGTDAFTPEGIAANTVYTYPSNGFGTMLGKNTWYPEIAISTIATGESTSHNITFQISAGDGNAGVFGAGYGNQISDCRWTFVPGPNNPSYAGVTPDEVAFARDNQYRGAVPSTAQPAGIAVTQETISAPRIQSSILYSVAGTALPSCTSALKGTQAMVSDATSPTFLGTYAGSGGVSSPVVCNGTNWVTY